MAVNPDSSRAPGRGRYDRSKSPADRVAEQRVRLLEAAADEFASRGTRQTTVEGIVARAGMSRRTFYKHFEGVTDALRKVFDWASSESYRTIETQTRDITDPIERIRVGIAAYMQMVADHGNLARVVLQEARTLGPEHAARHLLGTLRFSALLFEAIARAQARGDLSRSPDEITVFALASGIEATAVRYLMRGEERAAPESAERLANMVLRTFGYQ